MKKKFDYDLIIIGGGNAGCRAALLAANSKMKVAIIEQGKWGGSDLNYSNVPMGALIQASQLYQQAVAGSRFGLSSKGLRFNFPSLRNWKNFAQKRADKDYKKMLEDRGISCIEGRGHLISDHEVSDGKNILRCKKILLACGAKPSNGNIKELDGAKCLRAQDVPEMTRLAKSIFVIGAGATGCEIAQHFSALGSEVYIADYAARLLPREDEEIGQVLDYVFNAQKIKVLTQSRVMSVLKDKNQYRVIFLRGGLEKAISVDEVIFCTGSKPNTDIGLENAQVTYTPHGIDVDEHMQSSAKNIYAAGDICGGHSSPEIAEMQAETAILNIMGRKKVELGDQTTIRTIKTYPEVAEVGMTEDDCFRCDKKFKKISLALGEIPKSNIADFSDGFIKILYDKKDKIIGASIMAPHASLLIQEIALAMRNDLTLKDIAATPHARFEWSELVREAARQQ